MEIPVETLASTPLSSWPSLSYPCYSPAWLREVALLCCLRGRVSAQGLALLRSPSHNTLSSPAVLNISGLYAFSAAVPCEPLGGDLLSLQCVVSVWWRGSTTVCLLDTVWATSTIGLYYLDHSPSPLTPPSTLSTCISSSDLLLGQVLPPVPSLDVDRSSLLYLLQLSLRLDRYTTVLYCTQYLVHSTCYIVPDTINKLTVEKNMA